MRREILQNVRGAVRAINDNWHGWLRLLMATVAAALLSAVDPIFGLAKEPTKAQCTCHINPTESAQEGSTVVNATSCLQHFFGEAKWCDIRVITLDTMVNETKLVVNQLIEPLDMPTWLAGPNLTAMLFARFGTFAIEIHDPETATRHLEVIQETLKHNEQLMLQCVAAYATHGDITRVDEGFRCNVDKTSGWLRIQIEDVEDRIYRFLVEPPRTSE